MKLVLPKKRPRRYPWSIVGAAVLCLGIAGTTAFVLSIRFDEHGVAGPISHWRSAAVLVGVSFLTAYALTWLARITALRIGLVDVPKGRKCHARPTPLMGGVAVVGTLLAGLLLPMAGMGPRLYDHDLSWMMVSGTLLCLLGLWDDFKALPARVKFVGQLAAIVPFAVQVGSPSSLNFLGVHIPLGLMGTPITVAWLVSCVNVINLIDGHDGLAGSISAIAAFALAAIAAKLGAAPETALALLLGGSLLGFFLHNRPPARIFLGDAGSMPIGFFLGAIAVKAATMDGRRFAFVPPLVILSIPFFDTFVAIVRRKLNGRGIGEADREHIHHRLRERGLSPAAILAAIIGLCLASAAGAITAVYFELEILAVATGILVCSSLIASGLFAYEEMMLLLRRAADLLRGARQFLDGLFRRPTSQDEPAEEVLATLPAHHLPLPERSLSADQRKAA